MRGWRRVWVLAAFLLFWRCSATAASPPEQQTPPLKKKLTLEEIFAPDKIYENSVEPSTWDPDGTHLTCLHRRPDGAAELRLIDAKTGRQQVLISRDEFEAMAASSTNIDAVEQERRTRYGVAAYHWSPDSRFILFDVNGQLWLYELGSHRSHRLRTRTAAVDPKFSPDGRYLSYLMGNELYVREIQSDKEIEVTKFADAKSKALRADTLHGNVDWLYEEELGVRSNYFWNADGTEIAFLQTSLRDVPSHPVVDSIPDHPSVLMQNYPLPGDRLPTVRIGVVSRAGGNLRWIGLDTKDAYLPRFGWLKEGIVYAAVLDRRQQKIDLYFIDTRTGESRLALSEQSEDFIDVERHFQFVPVAGGKFLWLSWRDGFTHIYLYSFNERLPLAAKAKLERQLTSGNFEVSRIEGVQTGTGTVFYTANKDDDREQHLYSISIAGGDERRLTSDAGYDVVELNDSATMYLRTNSKIDRAPEQLVCATSKNGDCFKVGATGSKSANYEVPLPDFLDFSAEDGTILHGMLFRPQDSAGKVPIVLAPYGGPGGQLVLNRWSLGNLFDMALANRGIAVLVVDNRGSPNRGRHFEAAARLRLGEIELRDQLASLDQALARFPELDSSRVAFWGWSYGGFMTLYAMTHSNRFIAGCAGSPVADWRLYDATYSERFMGLVDENGSGYEKSSNLRSAGQLKGHLLMTHGLSDVNVHPQNTVRMADALIRKGIPFDMMLYPEQTHHFNGESELHVFQKFQDHLIKYLQPQGSNERRQ